ncbi:MAG: DUF1641 domain-containing protein, partial [Alicyclobacillaceae bacterium]|nr:DUF1641 domain-containing protein [Alicyclobacillaceae bacterium]
MAKPIRTMVKREYSPEEERRREVEQLMHTAAEHKEALEEALEVVALLHEKGILRVLKGVLAAGEELLEILVEQINAGSGKRVLKNMVQVGQWLSSAEFSAMAETARAVSEGVRQAAGTVSSEGRRPGLLDLMKAVRDPDVVAGLLLLLQAAKVVGSSARRGVSDGEAASGRR